MAKAITVNNLSMKVFTIEEIRLVLDFLRKKRARPNEVLSRHAWLNLIIFRLSCCCGLRKCEFSRLRLDDFMLGGSRPAVRVRKEITKGMYGRRRNRLIPLWWDKGTYDDIAEYIEWRRSWRPPNSVALSTDFETRWQMKSTNEYMRANRIWDRWKLFTKNALGEDRSRQLCVHSGRHSFCSHALLNGRSLVEVRDAAGHREVSMTNEYLHVLESGEELPDIFPWDEE